MDEQVMLFSFFLLSPIISSDLFPFRNSFRNYESYMQLVELLGKGTGPSKDNRNAEGMQRGIRTHEPIYYST
jgi:hypothetical protein